MWLGVWDCVYVTGCVVLCVCDWVCGTVCMWLGVWDCVYVTGCVGLCVCDWVCGIVCVWLGVTVCSIEMLVAAETRLSGWQSFCAVGATRPPVRQLGGLSFYISWYFSPNLLFCLPNPSLTPCPLSIVCCCISYHIHFIPPATISSGHYVHYVAGENNMHLALSLLWRNWFCEGHFEKGALFIIQYCSIAGYYIVCVLCSGI